VQKLDVEDALHQIEAGYPAGTSGGKQEQWYNPHLLLRSQDRFDLQRTFFGRLFRSATVYQLNAGTATVTEMAQHVLKNVGVTGR
jgi:hypothetical protein